MCNYRCGFRMRTNVQCKIERCSLIDLQVKICSFLSGKAVFTYSSGIFSWRYIAEGIDATGTGWCCVPNTGVNICKHYLSAGYNCSALIRSVMPANPTRWRPFRQRTAQPSTLDG